MRVRAGGSVPGSGTQGVAAFNEYYVAGKAPVDLVIDVATTERGG